MAKKVNGPSASERERERERAKRPAKDVEPSGDPGITKLREIVRILEASTLQELKYEDGDIAVAVCRQPAGGAPVLVAHPPGPAIALATSTAQPAPRAPEGGLPKEETREDAEAVSAREVHVMRSPFIGTFYSAPSPDAEPFTGIGKPVRRGQTLCIIEAMKLMNEIESEVDGTVLEILAENGKAVQYGDALFKIKLKAG
jgi:acetyl-CoA carboxylase biotin carboxyl carrier protein